MSISTRPTILLVYPSGFYYPENWERVQIKSSQLLLASFLAREFSVKYADFEISLGRPSSTVQIRRFERKVREYLEQNHFDILALSCWTSLSYRASLTVATLAREIHPEGLIVVGGYHPTARPREFAIPAGVIDYVIRGEGEQALREIARTFPAKGRPLELTIIDGPILQPDDFVEMNLDLVEEQVRSEFSGQIPSLAIYLSRGCPFECSFCMETLKDHHWRPYTPAQAIEQMEKAAARYPLVAIGFGDACFGVRPEWRREFFRRLDDLSPSYWVTFETRPEYLDEEDIKLLARHKVAIEIGVESCSLPMLQIMNKSRQPDKFLQKFGEMSRLLNEYGIIHVANMIFNHPGETERTLTESFAVMDSMTRSGGSSLLWAAHGYMHFPGSEVDRNQEYYRQKYGTVFIKPEWWKEDEDQIKNSLKVIPSSDLDGERLGLWRKMYDQREQRLKDSLTDEAFRFGADSFFSTWRNDTRYAPFYK